jgi:hypothetical protein
MSKARMAICGAIIAVFLYQCAKTGTNPVDTGTTPAQAKQTMGYSVNGDTIVFYTTTDGFCNGDSIAIPEPDSVLLHFEITGTSLRIYNYPESLKDMNDPEVMIQPYDEYTREGSGTSLNGRWKLARSGYVWLQGNLTNVEKETVDSEYNEVGDDSYEFEFDGDSVSIISQFSLAEEFVEVWTDADPTADPTLADSSNTSATALQVNDSTVQLTGGITGEVVTIVFSSNGDETYSSSVAANATGVYYAVPATCPNAPPAWYQDFLAANQKPADTTGMSKLLPRRESGYWPGSGNVIRLLQKAAGRR